MTSLTSYIRAEDGAVTVDWVVLTAALVGLALAMMIAVRGGVSDLAGDTNAALKDFEVSYTFEGSAGS